jgi:tRNA threonylcarbamoyladenosine biosynthesis protein TsaE
LDSFVNFENIDIDQFKHIARTFDFKNKIILLNGDLGSGKTTFVKSFVTRFGIDESKVSSPTFTIAKIYENERVKILHMDLYRLSSEEELYYIGFEDMKNDSDIILIEWPKLAKNFLVSYCEIFFEFVDMNHRNLKIYQ